MKRRWLGAGVAAVMVCAAAACGTTGGDEAAVQEGELRDDAGKDARVDGDGPRLDGDAPGATAPFVDGRDGKVYRTFALGGATWLARNLDWAGPGSFCWGDDLRSCVRDGRLYTFAAAKTACPPGTHLGTDDDWKRLEAALGMSTVDLDLEGYTTVRGTSEGATLRSETGFGASHGAGFRSGNAYDARDDRTYFWTATTRGADVWRRRITEADPTVFRFTNPPDGFAISVRCVLDAR